MLRSTEGQKQGVNQARFLLEAISSEEESVVKLFQNISRVKFPVLAGLKP